MTNRSSLLLRKTQRRIMSQTHILWLQRTTPKNHSCYTRMIPFRHTGQIFPALQQNKQSVSVSEMTISLLSCVVSQHRPPPKSFFIRNFQSMQNNCLTEALPCVHRIANQKLQRTGLLVVPPSVPLLIS